MLSEKEAVVHHPEPSPFPNQIKNTLQQTGWKESVLGGPKTSGSIHYL